jgi:hypothetical protein
MKKCSDCIYFMPIETVRDLGLCESPTPYWVMVLLEQDDYYVKGSPDGTTELCAMYTEDQIED